MNTPPTWSEAQSIETKEKHYYDRNLGCQVYHNLVWVFQEHQVI